MIRKWRFLGVSALVLMAVLSPALAEDQAPGESLAVSPSHEAEAAVEEGQAIPQPAAAPSSPLSVVESDVPEESGPVSMEPAAAPVRTDPVSIRPALQQMQAPQWGYVGEGAADTWGSLTPGYAACDKGRNQSPVNLTGAGQESLPPIELSYSPSALNLVNNGYTLQQNFPEGNTLRVDGQVYELLQLHFHTPSEHYIDGAPSPMEAHFVHKRRDGTFAFIGVMMKVGQENPVIAALWDKAPDTAGEEIQNEAVMIDPQALIPADMKYYRYDGSLTSPPCYEGVKWHVLKTPIEISEEQLRTFQALFPVNARPIQSLNGRAVKVDG